jgi:hypothetical protein
MNLEQRVSYFIINSILIGVCKSIQENYSLLCNSVNLAQSSVFNFSKLKKKRVHKIDLAKYYQYNKNLFNEDLTAGRSVELIVREYGASVFHDIRSQNGFTEANLLKAFSPRENATGMQNFQEGSGKSSSFFFFTDDKKFVIKTLRKSEHTLLIKNGLLEKYA